MASKARAVAAFVSVVVVGTLFGAAVVATVVLYLVGDWEAYGWGLWLTLRIVWGVWLLLAVGGTLTWVTMLGWSFRRPRPEEAPAALKAVVAQGVRPAAWHKSPWMSF